MQEKKPWICYDIIQLRYAANLEPESGVDLPINSDDDDVEKDYFKSNILLAGEMIHTSAVCPNNPKFNASVSFNCCFSKRRINPNISGSYTFGAQCVKWPHF